jgi:HD-like signal output (HDOD) protein
MLVIVAKDSRSPESREVGPRTSAPTGSRAQARSKAAATLLPAQASRAPEEAVAPSREAKRKLFSKLKKVRPMSASAQRVLALTGNPEGDVAKIADAISGDPALATETLRIANSAVYRRAYPVDDLRRAVTTIGLEQIHAMAMAMALLSTVSSDHPLFGVLHDRSLLAGTLAGLLTTEIPEVEKSAAFVAGLLSEIGAMACLMIDDDYADIYQSAGTDSLAREAAELTAYGVTTWEVGGQLLAKNQLPEVVVTAVGQPADLRKRNVTRLARIAVLSRSVAAEIASVRPRELKRLASRLDELSVLAGLEIDGDRLVGLSDWAISSASFVRAAGR